MLTSLTLRTPPLERVENAFLREHDVLLNVLRLDLIHPTVHGNKWYKLKYNLDYALANEIGTVLSFGGAYSNHLAALAAAGRYYGLRTIGVVRGELETPLNPVLAFAKDQGMELVPVSRGEYRRKSEPDFIHALQQQHGDFYVIPEGGSNPLAVIGCAEIARCISWQSQDRARYVGLACGTGTTMAGVIRGLGGLQASEGAMPTVLGVAVLKAPGYLQSQVQHWLATDIAAESQAVDRYPPWTVLEDYHAGGYARTSGSLRDFLRDFADSTDIPLEPVYTGKLFYGLLAQIRTGKIPRGSEITALHTGGIHR